MRELEFRAWNLLRKGWEYFTLAGLLEEREEYWHHYENWCQYTGLRDKNKVKTFEGDIVEHARNGASEYMRIVFENGGFYMINKDGFLTGIMYVEHSELKGNSFENPELLNVSI